MALATRPLERSEIGLVWTIDRREYVDQIYRLLDRELVLEAHDFDVPGWPPGAAEAHQPLLEDCFDRGGWFRATFDGPQMAAVAVVDPKRRGVNGTLVQLEFLHVGRDYRGLGLGGMLFEMARGHAKALGASGMYISATPSRNTVDFYRRKGSRLAEPPDPELFEREPEDIHLICDV